MSAGRKRVRSDANVNMSPEWTGGRWRATASIDREFIPFYQSQGNQFAAPATPPPTKRRGGRPRKLSPSPKTSEFQQHLVECEKQIEERVGEVFELKEQFNRIIQRLKLRDEDTANLRRANESMETKIRELKGELREAKEDNKNNKQKLRAYLEGHRAAQAELERSLQ